MAEFIQKHKLFSFYSALMIVVVLIAIFAPWLAPGDAFSSNLSQALQAPSSQHWFGTDKLGRDVLSRIIYGTQLSLFMGVSIVVIMVSIGTIIGAVAGYFGGKIEMVLMRLADIMLSFPGVVLAIAIAGILGGSIVNTIIALSVVGWAKYARLVRSMTLKVRGEEYVTAAVMMGASTTTILRRHIIPNILPLVVTTGALDIGAIMIEVAGLSFLGFGTMNGKDGKPFKTRDGGVMRLEYLLKEIDDEMLNKIKENQKEKENLNIDEAEAEQTAKTVALAAVKYGDLSNQASKDYIFDIDRFTSFEGNTGPYILYTIVRIKSILSKYEAKGGDISALKDAIMPAVNAGQKNLMLSLAKFNATIESAYEESAPHKICAYIYELANAFNGFYHDTKILSEENEELKKSYISLLVLTKEILEACIDMLGFSAPDRM